MLLINELSVTCLLLSPQLNSTETTCFIPMFLRVKIIWKTNKYFKWERHSVTAIHPPAVLQLFMGHGDVAGWTIFQLPPSWLKAAGCLLYVVSSIFPSVLTNTPCSCWREKQDAVITTLHCKNAAFFKCKVFWAFAWCTLLQNTPVAKLYSTLAQHK